MPDFPSALAELLARVQRPGGFHATGSFDIHPPRLQVDGVGPIALPLLATQAEQLVRVAEQAPYGRGPETLMDTEVRRTWQVDAERVHIGGRRWAEDLAGVVERVRTGLGVAGEVQAELYKLLVYDTGSFFVAHRDTEKAPGMFATLVVVLPCDYSGGELLIRHKGEEVRVDLHRDEPSEAAFAAFYADCRHEVLPIASGHRLALVYNLLRVGAGPLPMAPDYAAEQAQVADLLRGWAKADRGPTKLVYPLEHAYSEAELGFETLKGADAAMAGVVIGAAREAGCDLHLALLTVEESGWAEYTGGGRWDDPEMEVGEVDESRWTIHDWSHPDGGRPALAPLPFDEAELSPPDAFADLDDAEPEFEEATGNAGASFERSYQRAGLVLWPRARRSAVLTAAGLGVAVPALTDLMRRWEAAGASHDDPLEQEARELGSVIRAIWPEQVWQRKAASEAGHAAALLGALLRLGDLEGCAGFIAQQTAAGAYGPRDNPALAKALSRFKVGRAADLLTAVIAGNGVAQRGACAGLLALCTETDGQRLTSLRTPALALLSVLPDGSEPTPSPGVVRGQAVAATLVVDTLVALDRIDAALAGQALERFLGCPQIYELDTILLPAALALKDRQDGSESAARAALRRAVQAHLERRIAEPLEPPADWAREARVACNCTHCRDLSRFLAALAEPVWRLKAAQPERDHVTHSVSQHRCDLDLATDKRGRPYTLVCTKNRASFERRIKRRAQDLDYLGRLAD